MTIDSPSAALIDLNRKKSVCEKLGVPSYWIMEPRGCRLLFPLVVAFGRKSRWGGSVLWQARRFRDQLIRAVMRQP